MTQQATSGIAGNAGGPHCRRWATLWLVLLAAWAAAAEAGEFQGLALEQALDRLAARGLRIVYSSALVKPDMRVDQEPRATEPRAILDEILRPHGLAVADGPGEALLLVRTSALPLVAPEPAIPAAPVATLLSEVMVSASHYRFALGAALPVAVLTAGDIELLPDIGDDPLRAMARLPGIARQDFTSKPNVRGGVGDETLVRFDDLRLYNPYHQKDFQSLFSTIDPGIISNLSVYTAGFPVTYGDRMSSVVDIVPIAPAEHRQGQVALSLFNVGGRLAGAFDDARTDWLVAARRGNLDLLVDAVDPDLGQPSYTDVYGRLRHRFGETLTLSANMLAFADDLTLFDSDQEEQAVADYHDDYYWLRLDWGASQGAGGRVLAARTQLTSERSGSADLPGVARGTLDDRRAFTIDSLQADGWWPTGSTGAVQAGVEWRGMSGSYRYQDEAEFDVLFLIPGAPQESVRSRQLAASPTGDQYGAYLNWRFEPSPALTTDVGLRWDRETLTGGSDQLSPRLGLLWQVGPDTRVRASWGRFFQTQGIEELQISDGETRYFPAQRADHFVASVEHAIGAGVVVRVEAYRKAYRDLRPRFENLFDTLVVLPELKPDRARIAPAHATAEGAELSLTYDDARGFGGWLSYSASAARERIDGEDVRRAWDQAHSVSAGLSRRGPRWEMSIAATWHSGWPTTDIELAAVEPVALVAAGPRNAERLGSYARLDARIARRFELGSGGRLTLFFEVNNLSNRRNDCCVEYQLESDTGVPVLDVAAVETLPLVPSLGFVWDF